MSSSRRSSCERWFNASLYATLEVLDARPARCIAPTKKGDLCQRVISQASLTTAINLRQAILYLPPGSERLMSIRSFLILNCCKPHHASKLEADESGCLQALLGIYDLSLSTDTEKQNLKQHTTTVTGKENVRDVHECSEHSIKVESFEGQYVGNGMRLRGGKIVGGQADNLFVPHGSKGRSMYAELVADATSRSPLEGQIYSFMWPSHPGFVKIGYTKDDGQKRMSGQWSRCHPGAVLLRSAPTQYPHKLEKLIHRQLIAHRRKISVCARCKETHTEWFELHVDDINQVIDDWVELTKREPLYDLERHLTAAWKRRISKLTGDITARRLLDVLDAERIKSCAASEHSNEQLNSVPAADQNSLVAPKPAAVAESSNVEDATTLGSTPVRAVYDQYTPSNHTSDDKIFSASPISVSNKTAPTIPEVVATVVQLVQQQDQVLSFLQDFMSLLQSADETDLQALQHMRRSLRLMNEQKVAETPTVIV